MKISVFFASLLALVLCNPGASYCIEKKSKEVSVQKYTAYLKDPFDQSVSSIEYSLQKIGPTIRIFKFYPSFSSTASLVRIFEKGDSEDTKEKKKKETQTSLEKVAIPMTDFPLITVEQDDQTRIINVFIERESLEYAIGYLQELLQHPEDVFKADQLSQSTIDNLIRVFNALYYITKDASKRLKDADTVLVK
ncbi:MAG: hypothetical protein KDD46_04860 [Bdellovibrionales bacterium]|nr:hypothetical protein [Bdellovibrionales bacterium]